MYQYTRGRWAVAGVGYHGWRGNMAIGDGITSATAVLIGRYDTQAEAQAEAQRLTAEQPCVMPGDPSVVVYESRVYESRDYLSRQQIAHNQCRDCDRRVGRQSH